MGMIDAPALFCGEAGSVAEDSAGVAVLHAASAAVMTKPRINCRIWFISRETSEMVLVRRKSGSTCASAASAYGIVPMATSTP